MNDPNENPNHPSVRHVTRAYETDPALTRNSGTRINCGLNLPVGNTEHMMIAVLDQMIRDIDVTNDAIDRRSIYAGDKLDQAREMAWVFRAWLKADGPRQMTWQELLSARIREMTPEEFKERLVKIGVVTQDGKLTEDYK